MIISQTPYRVSFAGGGTDLPAFYRRECGAVLSTTIDHHMYVTIHRRFEPTIRVSYSRTETAPTLDEVQHELVREAMRLVEIDEPLEVTTIGDVPAGTGMGSPLLALTRSAHGSTNVRFADASRTWSPTSTRLAIASSARATLTAVPLLITVSVPSAKRSRSVLPLFGSRATTSCNSSSSLPAPTPSLAPRSM